jgi:hypothetical protein
MMPLNISKLAKSFAKQQPAANTNSNSNADSAGWKPGHHDNTNGAAASGQDKGPQHAYTENAKAQPKNKAHAAKSEGWTAKIRNALAVNVFPISSILTHTAL